MSDGLEKLEEIISQKKDRLREKNEYSDKIEVLIPVLIDKLNLPKESVKLDFVTPKTIKFQVRSADVAQELFLKQDQLKNFLEDALEKELPQRISIEIVL